MNKYSIYRLLSLILFVSLLGCEKDEPITCSTACSSIPPKDGIPYNIVKEGDLFYSGASFNPNSPDEICYRKGVVTEGGHTHLYVYNLATGNETRIAENVIGKPSWGPNNQILFTNSDVQLFKVRSDGDSLTQLTFEGRNTWPNWIPNSDQFSYTTDIDSGYFRFRNCETAVEVLFNPLDFINSTIGRHSWSTDNRIIVSGTSKVLGIFDFNDTSYSEISIEHVLESEHHLVSNAVWTNDNRYVIWSSWSGVFKTEVGSETTIKLLSACNAREYGLFEKVPNSDLIMATRIDQEVVENGTTLSQKWYLVTFNEEGENLKVLLE